MTYDRKKNIQVNWYYPLDVLTNDAIIFSEIDWLMTSKINLCTRKLSHSPEPAQPIFIRVIASHYYILL